ncbi:hypothetical protein [Nitrosopumilus sp.]|uniref:hypothetical protein n=1 Tax=Nitrosopumilus sp. TaxID=2024843 RepID=UPI00292DA7AF|nr:hypothetical protein [Nitrosopumilus sp.]
MLDSEIRYLADKVFVHRWPHDTPLWGDSVKKQLDDSINKKPDKKNIVVKEKTIQIEDVEFTSLKKIGISIPFFKNECTMIFEAQFGDLFSHVHITIQSGNFLDVFNQLILWRQKLQN